MFKDIIMDYNEATKDHQTQNQYPILDKKKESNF